MKNREEMLIKVIHALAEKFRTNLVLNGGMLLRLLNCPRSTQDVDYTWLSTESKKVLAKELQRELEAMDEVTIDSVNLNSRGIFIDIVDKTNTSIRGKIEIDVKESLNLPSEGLSTVALAGQYALPSQIVATVALPEAFSNKIAATLERNVARDLYDLSQFEPLCQYDLGTLRMRLSKLEINRAKSKSVSLHDASKMLGSKIASLNETVLAQELYPLLPKDQQGGLSLIIRAAVSRIAARLAIEEQ